MYLSPVHLADFSNLHMFCKLTMLTLHGHMKKKTNGTALCIHHHGKILRNQTSLLKFAIDSLDGVYHYYEL